MNFIQPAIDPVIFSLNFIEIRWYSLAYIFAFILGSLLMKKLNGFYGNVLKNNELDNFFIWAVLGVIIGGRIGYVFFYQLELFLEQPEYLFQIWNGGMSFHGGLLGIIISIYLFSKKNNIEFFYISDLVSVVAPIGLFLGRIANFINTELIGKPTDFFISVVYPSVDNLTRHPSQIYEAFFEGIILFFILTLYFFKNSKANKIGNISALFLIFYSIFRFFIEFLREPDSHLGLFFNMISMGQILSLPLLIFGIVIIRYNANKRPN